LSPRSPSLLDWDRRRRENDDGDGLLCSDRRHFDGSALSPSPDTPFPDFLNLRRSCALRILVFRPNPLLVPTGNPSQSPLSTHRRGFESGSFSFALSLALSPPPMSLSAAFPFPPHPWSLSLVDWDRWRREEWLCSEYSISIGVPSQSPIPTHRGGFDSGCFSFAVSFQYLMRGQRLYFMSRVVRWT